MRLGMRLESVDPAVADAVAELLLLPPQDRVGQVAGERLAQHRLLDAAGAARHGPNGYTGPCLCSGHGGTGSGYDRGPGTVDRGPSGAPSLGNHLRLRIHPHRHVEELDIQERHARLHAPGHHRLVRAQAVEVVQRVELAHGLVVELACIRRLVEVEIAAEDLVGALARQHHLHPHCLDPPRQQVHRRRRADRGDIERLDVADHLGQRVQAFLEGVLEAVVDGAERRGSDFGGGQVRRAFQPDRE